MTAQQAIQLITALTALVTAVAGVAGATYAHMRITLHMTHHLVPPAQDPGQQQEPPK